MIKQTVKSDDMCLKESTLHCSWRHLSGSLTAALLLPFRKVLTQLGHKLALDASLGLAFKKCRNLIVNKVDFDVLKFVFPLRRSG